ncbi:J domain-containing protein [Pelagibacterium sp. 26DY04]|uniref:J domain-containing protein n=1 Tax=unclassified Pelagibacterium TaxID=2623280 RepID=UPI002815489C|nr:MULTISPECIES: J domain-containing protein [unclassified Pelagibacterium]WMT86611.1 J domain-containing protein [Pelagibacterium sp. 26DY04]WMT89242.1 J domain-containing protein [Pelagibacterium sp. H642]
MSINTKSKLFDSVRIKPRRAAADEETPTRPGCDWEGCDNPGLYKAPKGARSEGQFHNFCLEHVRHYNKAYNYFSGMNDEEIAEHAIKMNAPGSRETWAFGSNRFGKSNPNPKKFKARDYTGRQFHDVNNVFARLRSRAKASGNGERTERDITLTGQDRSAFEVLGLEGRKPSVEIKSAYKALVKLHHPDANGGDKGSEDRLRSIIAAYNHLKSRGFV